ncbi:ammonium transporter Rh type B isoform X3 [Phalacrocorax aristotelis]|uniref:ammonium transporter Rh type B isoform X3 n=1 Tax=Phalacrocorax aristotelis TaxID=126867 RepID=UPI003F4BA01B
MPEHTAASRLRLSGLCFLLQILTIILFAVFVRYSPESSPGLCSQQLNCSWRNQDSGFQHPRFRDVHLQALLGFGLLMAFLGRYGPGSVAISILIVAFAVQWAVLIQGFLYFFLNGKIYVGAQSMVSADFCTAAVLVSSGALLGRVNPIQMLLLTLLGVTLFALNEYILLSLMGPHRDKRKEQQDAGHQPDVFAVVGTIYLWIFWPSFTSATTARDNTEPWALLNAYFSLAASTLATFVLSPVLYEESTLRMVQIQDATLASVAMMGMAGEMLVTPFGALSAGFLAGLIPPLGFRFLTAENPGHMWGSQHPRAAGDPGCLAGDAAGGTGHCRCLWWQTGARVPAGGPGQPDSQRPGALPALRPARHPAARRARGQPHGWLRKDATLGRAERSWAPAPWCNDPDPSVRSCTTGLNPLPALPGLGSFWQPEFPSSLLWRQPAWSPCGAQLLVPKVLGAAGCPRAFAG